MCPQCNAPKSRFAKYDAVTGKMIGGASTPIVSVLSGVAGVGVVGGLLYLATQSGAF